MESLRNKNNLNKIDYDDDDEFKSIEK